MPANETSPPTMIMLPALGGYLVGRRNGLTVTCWGRDASGAAVQHFGPPEVVASADGVRVYTSRESAARKLAAWSRELLQERYPEAAIVLGRDFAGAGAAIYGWWAKMPGGAALYLGRTLIDAVRR